MESAGKLLDRIDLMTTTRARLVEAAAFEDDPHVDTLDAIHVVTARAIGPALTAFITSFLSLLRR